MAKYDEREQALINELVPLSMHNMVNEIVEFTQRVNFEQYATEEKSYLADAVSHCDYIQEIITSDAHDSIKNNLAELVDIIETYIATNVALTIKLDRYIATDAELINKANNLK
jgi:hypothetical protein